VPNAQVCVFDDTYYKITTTNYISKPSLYTTFRMYSSGPWPLKILMFALNIDIKILGVPPLGAGMPFLDNDTCAEGGGGYLFMWGFSSLYDAIHGWMTRWMDGRVTWLKKLHKKRPRCPLLYVILSNKGKKNNGKRKKKKKQRNEQLWT
jgi:hypothetical protein